MYREKGRKGWVEDTRDGQNSLAEGRGGVWREKNCRGPSSVCAKEGRLGEVSVLRYIGRNS
jgi:hypothetical protein